MNLIAAKAHASLTPSDAIGQILQGAGNHLVLGYGYISRSGPVPALFDMIMSWLKADKNRLLSVYVGLIWDTRDPNSKAQAEVRVSETFEALLPGALYNEGIDDQIDVHAIYNFHPKFCLMWEWGNGNSPVPQAALVGSTNLSGTALQDPNRFELDVFMTGGSQNDLLVALSSWVQVMLDDAHKKELDKIGGEIRNRIYLHPVT